MSDFPVFDFDVRSLSISAGDNELVVRTTLALSGPTSAQIGDLIAQHHLMIGLKIFDMYASRRHDRELRGVLASNATNDDELFAKFFLSAIDFNMRESILGKIDFLYEGEYWFDERRPSAFFLAIVNPFAARTRRDVFEHYRAKVTGES